MSLFILSFNESSFLYILIRMTMKCLMIKAHSSSDLNSLWKGEYFAVLSFG